jgi:putative membrane protein
MKKLSYGVMIAAAGMLFQACHSNSSTTIADSINKMKDTTTTGKTGIAVVADDAKFAVDAANGGMTEVALSKLAIAKAANADVKKFATMMVMDHTAAGEQLKVVAKAKNITLPDSVNAGSKEAIADLSKKSGADFDKAYVDKMVADHKGAVEMFENASKTLKDADLKAFVDKTLPIIKGHLEHITKIKAGMK